MTHSEAWYIVKRPDGHCEIVPEAAIASSANSESNPDSQQWGPFESQQAAIARRVGLIRAGKCQPA
ncbi:MAG: DDE transposase family protein [Leptolyngbyaceae cyanobacterium SL_7_1]|nr:DDE transposase family protein [Leptolyngbyaceae cyanobacterium SL_7_1]